MKNFIKSIVLALVLMCSTSAMAQREGLSEAGVNFGLMTGIKGGTNFGIGVKYGYMASDNLRFEANGMYYFKSGAEKVDHFHGWSKDDMEDYMSGKSTDWFDINLNGHYLFNVADQVSIYPIFGFTAMIGKTQFDWKDAASQESFVPEGQKYRGDYSDRHFRFGVNLGFGGQYEITEDFAITLEAKYKLIKDFGNFNVALGCVVLF